MKAVCLQDIGKLELVEAEMPTINGPDEMIIKTDYVGVCGSEIHAFHGTHPYRKPPAILGHETLGTVVEVGSAVTQFAPGDRVT
ncbi:MAG: alcohol dehydrogenase catalytic domain-containing protein, partial [Chloroflexi bacterium]|nr:alcohol dehydrogenase catalytic domain-containing protein [Chloroflexota bacterium]